MYITYIYRYLCMCVCVCVCVCIYIYTWRIEHARELETVEVSFVFNELLANAYQRRLRVREVCDGFRRRAGGPLLHVAKLQLVCRFERLLLRRTPNRPNCRSCVSICTFVPVKQANGVPAGSTNCRCTSCGGSVCVSCVVTSMSVSDADAPASLQ